MELLILQFAKGKFTEAQAKHMLNGSFDLVWANIAEKFKTDGKYYWNDRLEAETIILKPGDKFHIYRGLRHQMTAITDVELFEFSTQHFDEDSIRIERGD